MSDYNSSNDFEESSKDAFKLASNSLNKNNIETIKKGAKTASKIFKPSSEAIKSIGSSVSSVSATSSTFIAGWPIFLVIGIAILLIIILVALMPSGLMDQDEEVKDKDSYNTMMYRASIATKEAIEPYYEVTLDNANKKINDYLKSHYGEYREYINLNVVADDINMVSENITGYIQAVNGVIQNWLPRDNNDNFAPGYDLETGKIVKENEYNTIGNIYKKEVAKEAKNIFYIGEVVEDIYDLEIKIPVLDRDGNHFKDKKTGEYLYDKKIVKAGNLYLDVGYNISNYKLNDIDKAIKYINLDSFSGELDEYTSSSLVYDAIYEMLYVLTGSYEIPSPHTNAYSFLRSGEDLGYEGYIGELIDLNNIAKGYIYARNSDEGYSIWKIVYDNAKGNYPVYGGGWRNQCTDLVHAVFHDYFGYDCGSGDGYQVAQNTVNKYPDKFKLSSTPAPGSIFSTWGGAGVNHVGFVVGVTGDNITFCDGNVKAGGSWGGIRWYVTMKIKDFENAWNGCVHYAIPR